MGKRNLDQRLHQIERRDDREGGDMYGPWNPDEGGEVMYRIPPIPENWPPLGEMIMRAVEQQPPQEPAGEEARELTRMIMQGVERGYSQ